MVDWLRWTAAFFALAVPGAIAFVLGMWLAKMAGNTGTADASPHLQGSRAQ